MKVRRMGPTHPACQAVQRDKYFGENEDFRGAQNRVASALQDDHEHYVAFRGILLEQRFMPPGRVQAGIGSSKNVTSHNCFVMPTMHDSFTDGPTQAEMDAVGAWEFPSQSIMDTAKLAAMTMRQGGGVGYDFSTLRPRGDVIRGVESKTDGPLAFAPIFDGVCRATSSAGNRRGAQMMVLRIDHPDIESFVRAKQAAADVPYEFRPLRGFNMSVAVTDEFMECLASGRPFPLRFGGRHYRDIDAAALWDLIMQGTYDWAEPGVLFIDQINRMNNLYYCETIAATNPCGEQPLPPYGACLLGSINLTRYLHRNDLGAYSFDYEQLDADMPHIVRAMDNVIDRGRYPLIQQKLEAQRKRRMGLGVTGLANTLEALGAPYGSEAFLMLEDEIMGRITRAAYRASALLAKEKGPFPLFDKDKYLKSKFIQSLDSETRDLIKKHGIRNSHLTSIAPTGTISFCADNISSGIEPVFSYAQERRVIMPEGPKVFEVPDYGVAHLGVSGRIAADVTVAQHVGVLCTAQLHVDSAVSKTCNVPTDYPYEDFKQIYIRAFEGGAKGCTTYRPAGQYDEPIKAKVDDKTEDEPAVVRGEARVLAIESASCSWDPVTGQRTGACAD